MNLLFLLFIQRRKKLELFPIQISNCFKKSPFHFVYQTEIRISTKTCLVIRHTKKRYFYSLFQNERFWFDFMNNLVVRFFWNASWTIDNLFEEHLHDVIFLTWVRFKSIEAYFQAWDFDSFSNIIYNKARKIHIPLFELDKNNFSYKSKFMEFSCVNLF